MSFCPNYNDPKYAAVVAKLKDPVKAFQYYNNYNGDLDTLYKDIVETEFEELSSERGYVEIKTEKLEGAFQGFDLRTIGNVDEDTKKIIENVKEIEDFLNEFIDGDVFNYKRFLDMLDDQVQTPNMKLYSIMNTLIRNIWNAQTSPLNLKIIMVPELPDKIAGDYVQTIKIFKDASGAVYKMVKSDHFIRIDFKKLVNNAKRILVSQMGLIDPEGARSLMITRLASLINHELLHSLHPIQLSEIPTDRVEEYLNGKEGYSGSYTAKEKELIINLGKLYKAALDAGMTADNYYGMKNLSEFWTEAMTNSNFQLALAKIPYKTTKKTLWKRFVQILNDYIKNFTGVVMKDSVLEEAINQITTFIEQNNLYSGRYRTVFVKGTQVSTGTQIVFSIEQGDQTVKRPDNSLKKEFLKMVKLYRKEVSDLQKNMVLSRVRNANLKLNTKFKINFKKVGQADLYTWEVIDMMAPLIAEKPAQPTRPDSPDMQITMDFYEERYTNDPSMNDWENPTTASYVLSPAIYDDINNMVDANTPALSAMRQLADFLSSSVDGVPYQFINQKEAEMLLGPNYKNQLSFFHNGTAYYIMEHVTPDIVFHEMGHPFVKAIAYYNPELFEKLYRDLMLTPEGAGIYNDILSEKYDIAPESARFKEEAIVRSLQARFKMENFKMKPSTGFAKLIKDILYLIKKTLRMLFGKKIDISKLDVNTTLDQLITMLEKGGEFKIDRSVVTTEDVEAYMRNNKAFIEEISLLEQNAQQALLRDVYDNVVKHIVLLKENKNYEALLEVLKDEFNETEFDAIKQNLSKHVDIVNKKADEFLNGAQQTNARATALVNSIHRLNKIMMRLDDHMDDLVNNIDDPKNGLRANYYRELAVHYEKFVNTLLDDMQKTVPAEASVRSLVNQLSTRVQSVLRKTQQFDYRMSVDALTSELMPIGGAINQRYEDIIEDLEERGRKSGRDPKKYIDAWYKEWKGMTKEEYAEYQTLSKLEKPSLKQLERLRYLQMESFKGAEITKEKIELALKGLSPDANPFSSFLEGYLYNPDVVVGGFALIIKNATTEYLTNAQSKMNSFFKDVYPLMEAAGFNPNKTDEFFDKITSLQTFGSLKDGEMVQKTVNSFLSIHGGNYRWERDSRRNAVTMAEAEYSYERVEDKRIAFAKAVKALRDWENKYMHQPYHPYFYKRYELFTDDEIGLEASARYEEAIQELGAYEYSIFSEDQYIDTTINREAVRMRYKQLFSRYKNGVKKEGFELLVTERLIAFKEKTKELYEWTEKPGAFLKALHKYQQELIDQGVSKYDSYGNPNPLFRTKTDLWIEANTVVKNKESYYDRRKILIQRYKEIMDMAGKEVNDSIDIATVFGEMIDLSRPHRGDEGEIEASGMTEQEIKKIKEFEEKIEIMKANLRKIGGLSEAQSQRLNQLVLKAKSLKGTGNKLDPWESIEMDQLFSIVKSNMGVRLSEEMKEELTTIFILLGEMTKYEPTMDYMDALNEILAEKEIEEYLKSIGKVNQHNQVIQYLPNSINALFTYDLGDMVIMDLRKISPRFKAWFDANHIIKKKWDPLSKTRKQVYERLYVWNVSRPTSEDDLMDTLITEEDGYTYTVKRVPSIRFYKRKVKDSINIIGDNGLEQTITLKTPEIIGVTKDNKRQWLPRTDVPNSPFINEEYVRLRDSKSPEDKALFLAVEALKEYHLKNQEGLSYHSKLYYDVPRYQKDNLDLLRTRKKRAKAIKDGTNAPPDEEKAKGLLGIMIDRAKQFLYGARDAAELGGEQTALNYKNDTMILVRMDSIDNEITDIPIGGLYDIDHFDVSTDISKSLLRYMLSAERHKKLLEISPVAQAIQNTVIENRPNPKNEINKKNLLYRSILSSIRPKDESVREKAIKNLIEREFQGQVYTGWGSDSALVNNMANFAFKLASFGYFAFNIPAAIKNMLTPKIQGAINASGGEFFNYRNQAAGEAWAFKTMGQMSFEIYQAKAHSLDMQLVEILDIIPNRFVEKFGEKASRTLLKDTVGERGFNLGWFYNFRKWTESQSTLALGGAMMDKQLVKTKDGSEMKFIDAWELNNEGKIQLKANVDPEWGITYDENGNMKVGKEFKRFKNYMQQAGTLLQGAYAQFEQPEMQRYLLGRFISYMKKYLTPTLVARWGFQGDFGNVRPRFNAGLGNTHMGYYITTLRALLRIVKSRGGWMHFLTPNEKSDILKTFSEIVIAYLLLALLGPLFDWDPEEEDKYKELMRKSGPLPLPGIQEDRRYPFEFWGFLENHALLMMMQLRNENEQYIPWPNYGLDDYVGILNLKSVAVDPTFKKIEDILSMMLAQATGDPDAYYERKIGPYAWQQEGGSKLINYIFKTFGVTGSAADPVKGIKDLIGVKARK